MLRVHFYRTTPGINSHTVLAGFGRNITSRLDKGFTTYLFSYPSKAFLLSHFLRVVLEEEHKSALEKVHSELEEARISETKLRRETSKKSSEISVLHQQLEETGSNLEYSWRKIETLGEQCENMIDQQAKVTVNVLCFRIMNFTIY